MFSFAASAARLSGKSWGRASGPSCLHQQWHPGNLYPRILELPLFGHSDNHAALQIADLVCPALLFPMAAQTYCTGHYAANPHVQAGDAHVGARYRAALNDLSLSFAGRTVPRRRDGGRWD